MKWLLGLTVCLFGLGCEQKKAPAEPAPAAAESEPVEEPPVQVAVTADEVTAFQAEAEKKISAENADQAAAALLAEIEADLAID